MYQLKSVKFMYPGLLNENGRRFYPLTVVEEKGCNKDVHLTWERGSVYLIGQRYSELQNPAISSALSGTCVFTGGKVCVMNGKLIFEEITWFPFHFCAWVSSTGNKRPGKEFPLQME